ncbi:MAG: AAA family ATPase [Atopobiaceae bacterium]|nr:AAA family ATPase [Atopobiaceae bacterium]
MGMYINPGNEGFAEIVAEGYVDKTGLIELVNKVISTSRKLVVVTRPRRFGKTFAAKSLVAYYSCGCESRALFDGLQIASEPSFERHLNAYNVVRLDMTAFSGADDVAGAVTKRLIEDLVRELPGVQIRTEAIDLALTDVVEATNRKFVFVIDEWDAPLRERRSKASQEGWVYFLRLLFKNMNLTDKVVAAAYMTGILPIVRYGTQSALSDFREYTMLSPDSYAPYVGFTQRDVEELVSGSGIIMDELRRWYDGYELPYYDEDTGEHSLVRCFAPYSVTEACNRHNVGSYWVSSEAFESLCLYIDMDFDGLQQAIVQAVGGASVRVDTGTFENDMHELASRDDVLTLLCHLGYLVFDSASSTAHIPNEEVRAELRRAVGRSRHAAIARIVRESDALLRATWDMDEDAVAKGIAHAHDGGCAPVFYNDEQSLRAVVKSAYIAAIDRYATIEELPSGRGLADVVFLPKRGDLAPAIVVELKWSRSPGTAMEQIRNRDYGRVLRDWDGPTLLVGITYDPKTKNHVCRIEEA